MHRPCESGLRSAELQSDGSDNADLSWLTVNPSSALQLKVSTRWVKRHTGWAKVLTRLMLVGRVAKAIGADTAWIDDSIPAGAYTAAGGGDAWQWVSANPTPFSGSRAHQSSLSTGLHYHYFSGASATLAVNAGDVLVTYIFLDPVNPPREVMLQWFDGASSAHAAYWGENLVRWGTDGTASQRPMGALPSTGQWVRLEVPASMVALEGATLQGMNFILYGGRATWDLSGKSISSDPPPPLPPPPSNSTVWVDDAVPSGAWTAAAGGDVWQWISANPAPRSGTRAHQSALVGGTHYHYFSGATTTLQVNPGDTLFTYIFLDPANPPREAMLQWFDGSSWAHAAYWGANLILWGTDGTASQRPMGALPSAGQWARLEVPASLVGLEGRTLQGMNFILYDGRATWDYSGKSTASEPPPPPPPTSATIWVDDAVPSGAWTGAAGGDSWQWVSANPAPYSGSRAHQSALVSGTHYHFFSGATSGLPVNAGDILFTYVFLDPSNPPQEVRLQWFDGASWAHAAYWGANRTAWGTDGTPSQQPMGLLPSAGAWARLEVPAGLVGLEGKTLFGMNFILYDGRATWDYTGTQAFSSTSWVADANTMHYPDLQTMPPTDLRIQNESSTSQKLLRFSNWIVNRGRGRLEIIPINNANGTTDAWQRLYSHDANGNWYVVSTAFVGQFDFHPEHNHWHFENFARYQLRNTAADGSVGSTLLSDNSKVSFCVEDVSLADSQLSHVEPQTYTECTQTKPQGLSVGWADVYAWDLFGQSLDVTGLPDGDYWLLSTSDPDNLLNEGGGALESNNTAALKIRIEGMNVTAY
ncbi:MAG: hypothetical protein HYY23_17620 [Verrucomicrobia bacterium]|nr:hypothetical protein [Verrucomicrobiota bacterium]